MHFSFSHTVLLRNLCRFLPVLPSSVLNIVKFPNILQILLIVDSRCVPVFPWRCLQQLPPSVSFPEFLPHFVLCPINNILCFQIFHFYCRKYRDGVSYCSQGLYVLVFVVALNSISQKSFYLMFLWIYCQIIVFWKCVSFADVLCNFLSKKVRCILNDRFKLFQL